MDGQAQLVRTKAWLAVEKIGAVYGFVLKLRLIIS